MDEAANDVLAYMAFPKEHREKLHSTDPIERLHAEIKRRTNTVGIFPNVDARRRRPPRAERRLGRRKGVQDAGIHRPRERPSTTVKLPAVADSAYRPYPPDTAQDTRLLHHRRGNDRKLLGHLRHRTTAGYAHLDDAHLVEAEENGKRCGRPTPSG